MRHEALPAVLLDVVRHDGSVQQVGRSTFRVVTLPRVDDLDMAIGRIGNFLKSYRQ